ncbi:MAG: DUF2797 domain-containing protein [Candidatus Nanohaloarchaea archaeon]
MRSIVKVSWKESDSPRLKLASEEGFEHIDLAEGRNLDLEVIDERRCTGYHAARGELVPCPEFRSIESGDQCPQCRGKDIYTEYRQGSSGERLDSEFSVYIAQCGSEVKVGVTRSSRLETRWLEQGANYAAEIFSGLSAEKALEKESELSDMGLKERIRKERKTGDHPEKISEELDRIEADTQVKHISKPLQCSSLERKGLFPSPIRRAAGQIVSDGRRCLALVSGKVVVTARQRELEEF